MNKGKNTHVHGIPTKLFNWGTWSHYAYEHAVEYKYMWMQALRGSIADSYKEQGVLMVKYEDLLDHNMRYAVLDRMLKFLKVEGVSDEQKKCAFHLSSSGVKRRVNPQDMKKEDAFNPAIVCMVWHQVSRDALAQNYTRLPGDFECNEGQVVDDDVDVSESQELTLSFDESKSKKIDTVELELPI